MSIEYRIGRTAQDALLSGVRQLAELVCITLGPKGRNVALDRLWSSPSVVHDGITVAKEIFLPDLFENMGAQLVLEASDKTNDNAGDGTTTSCLLAWKLIEKGFSLVQAGANPMILKEDMQAAVTDIIEVLWKNSHQLGLSDVKAVATISAANEEIGNLIAEAVAKVGRDGVITVDEGMAQQTTIEYKEGMSFDRGYGGPSFVTDEKAQIAQVENPYILFTDMAIDSVLDLSDMLEHVLDEAHHSMVIIADSFGPLSMSFLVDNVKRGVIRLVPIQAPSFGFKRIAMLEDMAILTGGTVLLKQSGRPLSSVTVAELGKAEKVWSDVDNTRLIGGAGAKVTITERIASLRNQIEREDSEFERRQLEKRIATLSGGVAILKVGALTDTELKDRVERVRDAVEATKSAVAEGIVAGGGVALLNAFDALVEHPMTSQGYDLVLSVLKEPIHRILTNAGEAPEEILENILIGNPLDYGYNVMTREYGDMFEMGVIDPLKVVKEALQNSVSVASMILTTEGLIARKAEDRVSPLEKIT